MTYLLSKLVTKLLTDGQTDSKRSSAPKKEKKNVLDKSETNEKRRKHYLGLSITWECC